MDEKYKDEFLDCVVITALEGGIGYWSVCSEYNSGSLGEPARAVIQEFDESTGEPYGEKLVVDRALITKALDRITDLTQPRLANKEITKYIIFGVLDDDPGNIDTDCADVIVQVGLFGKIVYG